MTTITLRKVKDKKSKRKETKKMARNWTAYEAAKEIYGENKENITEIGSRFPLLTRTVAMANSEYVLAILEALPKVTARVLETGLKENTSEITSDEVEEDEEVKPAKTKKTKAVEEDEEDETSTYEEMTGKELYAICCKRGISSMCKSRSKDALIELLNKFDNGELETKEEKKKASKTKTKVAPKVEEPEEDDERDDEDEEENTDPYAGKNARELFAMCKERGIKAKPKQNASVYADLLKADDAKAEDADTEDEEDDDDDWEI